MDKKTYATIIFFFIAALLAYILNLSTSKRMEQILNQRKTSENTQVKTTPAVTGESFSTKADILDLIALNKPLRCGFEVKNEDNTFTATVYVDGSNARANMNSVTDGIGEQLNTIINSEKIYVWKLLTPEGVRIDLPQYKEGLKDPSKAIPYSDTVLKFNQKYNYNCAGWDVNADMFTVPAGIHFVDLGKAIDQIKDDPCLICDAIEETDRRAACVKAYNCK